MTIGWALIGTGRVHQTMAPAIGAAAGTRLVAVLSRDQQRAAAFAAQFGIAHAHDSLQSLLANPEVDVVYVASPNGLHVAHAVAAARAGKHVFCEKPLALSLDGCRDIRSACRAHGVQLGLGVMFRQHPAHRMARALVADGALGEVVQAQIRLGVAWRDRQPDWYADTALAGAGVLYMAGVHRIDLLRYVLASEVREVSAMVGEHTPQRPWDEWATALLRFDNGVRAGMDLDIRLPNGNSDLEIHGTRGSLVVSGSTTSWWGGSGSELLLKTGAATECHQFDRIDLYRSQVEDFNRAIAEGADPAGDGHDGQACAQICMAMLESSRSGRTLRLNAVDAPGAGWN